MHSSRYDDEKKLLDREKELGIRGILKHLEELGWSIYQWRYEEDLNEGTEKQIENYKKRFSYSKHFVEVFSPYYNGMLRGESKKTLREAVEKCLTKAQGFCKCEHETGHEYVPYKRKDESEEYDNGLVMCKHCGFWGYTNKVKVLEREKESIENELESRKKNIGKMYSSSEKFGFGFNMFGEMMMRRDDEKFEKFMETKGLEIEKMIKQELDTYISMKVALKNILKNDEYHGIEIDTQFIEKMYQNQKNVMIKFMIGSKNSYNFEIVINNPCDDKMVEIISSDDFVINDIFDFKKLSTIIKKRINRYDSIIEKLDKSHIDSLIFSQYKLLEEKKRLQNLPKNLQEAFIL